MWFRALGSGIKVLCFCSAEFGDCHGGLGVGIGVWWVLVVRFHGLGTRVWALGFVLVRVQGVLNQEIIEAHRQCSQHEPCQPRPGKCG